MHWRKDLQRGGLHSAYGFWDGCARDKALDLDELMKLANLTLPTAGGPAESLKV